MKNMKFHTPTSISISGTTGAGKTQWLMKLLIHKQDLFSTVPEKILYCYGAWQPLFEKMEKELTNIEFTEGLPTPELIKEYSDLEQGSLIILDDLLEQVNSNNEVQNLFTKGSHHKNITLINITQNI